MSKPDDPAQQPAQLLIQQTQAHKSQPTEAKAPNRVQKVVNDVVKAPIKKLEPVGPLLGGMLIGLAMILVGGLGYWLAITFRQLPRSIDLPLRSAPSSEMETNKYEAPFKAALPPDVGHIKRSSRRMIDEQRSDFKSIACLSGNQTELQAPADPSNYGPRLATDWMGRPVSDSPSVIVLHETVVDERTAMALFLTPHISNAQQASYHVLISRDGRRMRLVPDSERAYGAGNSDYEGLAVQLKPGLQPSLNNVALHVSLVSPPDGADGDGLRHSGYTNAQYSSLAAQIAQWMVLHSIKSSMVVTHQEVDRSGSRRDPRSFNWNQLDQILRSLSMACGGSPHISNLGRSGGRTQGL